VILLTCQCQRNNTQPFLGKQTPNLKKIDNLYLGLEKLYLGAFKNWRQFLKPDAKIVII